MILFVSGYSGTISAKLNDNQWDFSVPSRAAHAFNAMVGATGIEPVTPTMST
jgi:hypothetical protein